MEVTFTTKKESNKRRREEFLALSGAERVMAFLALSRRVKKFPSKYPQEEKKDNFVIDLSHENLGRKN